jgi:flavorubredoxin
MNASVTTLTADTYRISTYDSASDLQTNQFLIVDDQPLLMHTGFKRSFPATIEALGTIVDPAKLRWIGLSHFEADECGALNQWLAVAPNAQALCSIVAARASVSDFADRPPRSLADGDLVTTGGHRLRFLSTPHVPHGWDAGLFFDEAERTLLCSDLFFHFGDPEPLIDSGIVQRARDAIRASLAGPMGRNLPYTPSTQATLERLAMMEPRYLATMHGSSYRGDGRQAILHLAAVMNDLLGRREGGC